MPIREDWVAGQTGHVAEHNTIGSWANDKMGRVWMDDYGRDDTALTAILSDVGADTHPRAIHFSNRSDGYDFSTVNRVPPRGMKLVGPFGFSNPEVNTQLKMNCRINLNGTGTWFTPGASDAWDCSFKNLTLVCASTASFLDNTSTGLWRGLHVENIAQKAGNGLLGTYASGGLNVTVFTAAGYIWQNGAVNTSVHLKGSDIHLMWNSAFFDSVPANCPAYGRPHVWFDWADNCRVGPAYITAEGNWRSVLVDGPNPLTTTNSNSGHVDLYGWTMGGRNPTQPGNGSTLRVQGGRVTVWGGEVKWGMASPTGDSGVVHHSGGILTLKDVVYDRASGQAESVKFVYSSGGARPAEVKGTSHTSRGGTWTGLPQVSTACDRDAYVTGV
jgi:hypothetical protein